LAVNHAGRRRPREGQAGALERHLWARKSRRDLPLDPDLVLALREQRLVSEGPGDDDPVFRVGCGS
jgi:hypothetical protein